MQRPTRDLIGWRAIASDRRTILHPYLGLYEWERDEALQTLQIFRREMLARVIAAFDEIEAEANQIAEEAFKRFGQTASCDQMDMSDAAEHAQEEGAMHYSAVISVRYEVLRLAISGLYHLWERQIKTHLIRMHGMLGADKSRVEKADFARIEGLLKRYGFEFKAMTFYNPINELRLFANATKHGAGSSCNLLFVSNPKLFFPYKLAGEEEYFGSWEPSADDLQPEPADFSRYSCAVEEFWTAFPHAEES